MQVNSPKAVLTALVPALSALLLAPAGQAQGIAEMGAVYSAPKGSTMMNSTRGTIKNLYGTPNLVPGQMSRQGRQGLSKKQVEQAGKQSIDLWNKGKKLEQEGKLSEAAGAYRKALSIREQIWGSRDPAVLQLLTVLGTIDKKQGNLPEAEAIYRKALKVSSRKYGPGSAKLCKSLGNLADILFAQKKYSEAASHYRHMAQLYERQLGADNQKTIDALARQADALIESGNHSGAESLLKRSLKLDDRSDKPADDAPGALVEAWKKLKSRQGAASPSL